MSDDVPDDLAGDEEELLDVLDHPAGKRGTVKSFHWHDENTVHVEIETDTRRVIERYEFVRAEEYPKED